MLSMRLAASTALITMAIFAICVSIASVARAGRVEAENYERAAHKYATFIISRRSGLSLARSHRLSFFSQFPDDEYCLNAISAGNQPLRKRNTVHSLHGGAHAAIHKRQSDLRSLIRRGIRTRELSDFQLGIVVHALADSYAHTYRRHGKLLAFGPTFGHTTQSITSSLSTRYKDPDRIAHFPEKFKQYACDLLKSMTAGHRSCHHRLGPMIELVDDLSPDGFDELPRMIALAKSYGFRASRYKALAKKHRMTAVFSGALSSRCTSSIPQSAMFAAIRLMEEEFAE